MSKKDIREPKKRIEVNMKQIAEIFDVSIVTVSKALNDKDGVGDELREKIKQKAEELGYRVNIAARSLKTRKSYNIGVLIANRYVESQESYYFSISSEIVKRLNTEGYSGIIEILLSEDEERLILPNMYNEQKVDGLIVLGQLEEDYLKKLETIDIPLLYMDFYVSFSNADSIVIDNFFSSYEVTHLLIEKGHERIGFVGNISSTSSIQDRFLGFYKALLENHLPLNNDYIISDRDGLGKLIDFNLPSNMPTAFVANCDQTAYKLIKKLKEGNYKVPEEVSVVSFDNSIFSTISEPQITTIDNNIKQMVETASKIIVKKIKNPKLTYGRIFIKGKTIIRDSTKIRLGNNL